MIENNNNTYFPDVKTIVEHLKSLKEIDPKELKKNMHTLESVSPYVVQFYNIYGKISKSIIESSKNFDRVVIDAQNTMIESLTKMMDVMEKINELKTPNFILFKLKLWRLKKEVKDISTIFLGRNGIVKSLSIFDVIRSGGIYEEYDEKGNIVSKTKVNPFNPSDTMKTFQDLMDVIINISDQTADLAIGVISSHTLINIMWPQLIGKGDSKNQPGIINRYIELIKSKEFKYLQDANISEQFSIIANNVESINSVILALTAIDLKLLKSIIKIANIIDTAVADIEIIICKISNFSQIVKSKKFAGIKPQITTIKSIIDSMLNLTKDIALLGLTFIPLTLSAPLALGALWIIGGFVKTAIHVINWISTKNDYSEILTAVTNITGIVGLMLLMVGMVIAELILISLSLPILIKSADSTIVTFAIIALIVYAIARLAVIINKIVGQITVVWNGLLAIVGLIGVLLLTAGMLILFASIASQFFKNNNWLMALAMFGVVALVTIAIGGLGYLIALWVPGITMFTAGVVLITIAIGAMLLIGVELIGLARFNFTESKRAAIKASTIAIVGAAKDVMNALFYGISDDDIQADNSNSFVKFFRSIFGGAAFALEALAASFVMVMTTISVTMMLLIGLELEQIAKFKLDRGAVVGGVNTIMGTADAVIDAIFQPAEGNETPGGAGFIGALKHFFTGLADIIELIASIGKISLIMISIGIIRLLGSELKWISNFDISSLKNVTTKVNQIMSTADAVVDAIFAGRQEKPENEKGSKFLGFIKNTFKNIGGVLESIIGVGKMGPTLAAIGMIDLLSHKLQTINDISNNFNKKQILDNANLILGVSNDIVKKVFDTTTGFDIDEKKIKKFNKLTSSLEDFIKISDKKADNLEKNIDNTIKFVDKINAAKLENLQTATNMFEKMADFSKSINGNFQGLADAINDRIMPLLEKLNETFENTNKVIENGSNTHSSTPITTAPAPVAQTTNPVNQEIPTGTQTPTGNNYSAAISEIRQELSRIYDALTDGSQVTRLDDR